MSDWDDGWNDPWREIFRLEALVEKLEERIEKLERDLCDRKAPVSGTCTMEET